MDNAGQAVGDNDAIAGCHQFREADLFTSTFP